MRLRLGTPFVLAALLLSALLTPISAAAQDEAVTARLGISAGDAIQEVPQGTTGPELEAALPGLWETAAALGVEIQAASVGQGFWPDEGAVGSEHDLDLVVSGAPDAVNALAATLGRDWGQSVVLVWYTAEGASQANASIPLPGGAEALTPEIYTALVTELVDGGHVRYAGADSMIFVANTGTDDEAAFLARMERVRTILSDAGVESGEVEIGHAEMVWLEAATYEEFIAKASGAEAGNEAAATDDEAATGDEATTEDEGMSGDAVAADDEAEATDDQGGMGAGTDEGEAMGEGPETLPATGSDTVPFEVLVPAALLLLAVGLLYRRTATPAWSRR